MSLGLHLAKVRLSERNTKEKLVFFCTSEREYLGPTDQRYDYASEQQRKSRFLLYFRAGLSSQQSCRDISPFTLLRSKAMLTLFVLKDVVQVGHDDLQVFVECKFYILDDFQRSLFIIICKGCESSELFGNDCVKFLVRRFFLTNFSGEQCQIQKKICTFAKKLLAT